jgi:hypothetical protein
MIFSRMASWRVMATIELDDSRQSYSEVLRSVPSHIQLRRQERSFRGLQRVDLLIENSASGAMWTKRPLACSRPSSVAPASSLHFDS